MKFVSKSAELFVMIGIIASGCTPKSYPRSTFTIVKIGDCTTATGGWEGRQSACRVTFDNGARATMIRPVEIGDRVHCFDDAAAIVLSGGYRCAVLP